MLRGTICFNTYFLDSKTVTSVEQFKGQKLGSGIVVTDQFVKQRRVNHLNIIAFKSRFCQSAKGCGGVIAGLYTFTRLRPRKNFFHKKSTLKTPQGRARNRSKTSKIRIYPIGKKRRKINKTRTKQT